MIRSLASLLLLLGLLAMPGGGVADLQHPASPSGVKAEAVLDAAPRGAETAEPADEPLAALIRRHGEPDRRQARPPLRPPVTLNARLDRSPFRARAPPMRDVLA